MLKHSSGQALLSVVRQFAFARERRITSAPASIGALSLPSTCPARRLTLTIPPPTANTGVCDLVTRYVRAEYPQAPVWSLADLEPSPPFQKSLRRQLEVQRIEDLQFLRWRNASLPFADFPAAVGYLSYALLPTSSVFDRREDRIAGAQPWDLSTPLNDENCAKIADKTPFWVIERLFKLQSLSPKYISAAVNLLRQYPAGQSRDAFMHIILSCIAHQVHSVLPRLLKALRDDHGVSSELFGTILRALVNGPLVPISMPALPDRSIRKRASHSKCPKPGPRTSLVTFATHNEIRLILCHMIANGMKLEESTHMHLANARPALPSYLMRILTNDCLGNSPPTERKLVALARSFAREGRSFEIGRILDRLRKYRIMYSSPAVVPVSAAFDKRLSSDSVLPRSPRKRNVDYGRLNSPATEREAVTRLNAMFLHAFRKDRRSRDPARFPHAAMSYFRRLQLHSERSIGARASLSPSAPQGSHSRGMMTAWNSFITCMASQRDFPPEKLLGIIDAVSKKANTSSISLQVPTMTACILGLVRRAEYNAALQIWTRFVANDIASARAPEKSIDWVAATAGGRALSESGHLAEAFQLLNDVISKNRVANHSTHVRDTDNIPSPAAASVLSLTIVTAAQDAQGVLRFLTSFMRTLAHRGRPDVVYMLWDSMQQLYGVRPNDYTLNTLLVTASSSSAPSKAVSLSQQMGWRARASRHGETRIDASDRITNIMDTLRDPLRLTKDAGFWWCDRPAWQTARQIFREVILGNWPQLALLRPPAVAHPEGFHPLIGLPRLRLGHPNSSDLPTSQPSSATSTNTTSLARIPRVTVGKYYDIIPTQRSFDAYIRLLCEHRLEAEIPEALLWQRELGILPSHRSLRIALMRFSAVGTSAPFDEAVLLKRGEAGSPYGKLKAWIRDWVPKGYMPTEGEIEKERMLWGTSREHWARQRLEKDLEKRRAKWRRSRKDLRRRGPEKRQGELAGSEATSHEARVMIW